ncbi:MAG: DUF2974 domain-containing protein [Erysipelotrichales bacterium]|nr:DUF2974 domain-containing protein [Erysipelotrichales bacterium]
MDVFGYIILNGHYTFEEKEFNEVDNIILSSLMYLDFTRIVQTGNIGISLHDAGHIYLETNKRKDIYKLGIAQISAYRILESVIDTNRYKNINLSSYRYITGLDTQFSALTFNINKSLKYIGFEGTDELISGWKEDAYLSFKFPVDAQKYAIDYIKEVIKFRDKNIIIGGHSKGGNLALVAGMYTNPLFKRKIKQIISNDGPGLRKEEFISRRYKSIRNKYTHIIPSNSLIGTLLYNDTYKAVKTNKRSILAHDLTTWLIDGEHFIESPRDKRSLEVEKKLNEYISSLSYKEQEMVVKSIFKELEQEGLNTVSDLFKFRKLLNIVRKLNNINPKCKSILIEVLEIIINNYI